MRQSLPTLIGQAVMDFDKHILGTRFLKTGFTASKIEDFPLEFCGSVVIV